MIFIPLKKWNNRQAMTKDIYQTGMVPDKKYVNLRLGYLSSGTGIICSALFFSEPQAKELFSL
jgi:hypothetical protein